MSYMPYSAYGRRESAAMTGVVAKFMSAVYAWMAVGLATTAIVAWFMASRPDLIFSMYNSGLIWILLIAEIAIAVTIGNATQRIGAGMATLLFGVYAALNGVTLSVLLLMYTTASLGAAFGVTAGTFGVMSLIGFTTKRDLTQLGSLLMMALVGVIIASVVNIFVASTALHWIVTYVALFVFIGLTAYDTQKLKGVAYATEGNEAMASRFAVVGSLILYLDFINIFILLLRVMGDRRN